MDRVLRQFRPPPYAPRAQGVATIVKRLVLLLALASGAFAAGAQAHVFDVATSVTARDIPAGRVAPGARVVVVGRVLAARDACEGGKLVKLFRVKPGADQLLATDRTDGDGEYG